MGKARGVAGPRGGVEAADTPGSFGAAGAPELVRFFGVDLSKSRNLQIALDDFDFQESKWCAIPARPHNLASDALAADATRVNCRFASRFSRAEEYHRDALRHLALESLVKNVYGEVRNCEEIEHRKPFVCIVGILFF
jgi:hypothetical protein